MAHIDRNSPIPAYYQIALDIRNQILQQELQVGDRLPPETTLVGIYQVSRVTIRQALEELIKDGFLERRRGIGTFIKKEPITITHDLSLPHVLAGRLRSMGLQTSSQIVEAQNFTSPLPEVGKHLQLAKNTPVAYLKRVLLIGERPAALNRSWFSQDRCPGIADQALVDNSLSLTLRERYGLVPAYADNWLEVILCAQETARLLDGLVHMPMILVRSVSYLQDDTPLEFSLTEWRGDRTRFNFQANLLHKSGHSNDIGQLEIAL